MTASFDIPRTIRWIAFDVVGTLLYADPSPIAVYHRVAQAYGSRLNEREIGHRFFDEFRRSERNNRLENTAQISDEPFRTSEKDERRRWETIVARVLDDVDEPRACFQELFEYFARPDAWTLFPDVEPAVGELHGRGYRLALASNFDARLHGLCKSRPPLRLIDLRIISSEVGYRKPSRRFYDALLQAADCRPDEILMVGDDYANDVEAARSAGLTAVYLRRSAAAELAPGEIADLRELVPLLDNG